MSSNSQTCLELIKQSKPKTRADFNRLFDLEYIGRGVYRRVYRIKDTNLVVKLPVGADGINHTRLEARRIKRLSRFRWMRKHLPPVLYYDPKAGVLVTWFYKRDEDYSGADGLSNLLTVCFKRLLKSDLSDLHAGNVILEEGTRTVKIIDLAF